MSCLSSDISRTRVAPFHLWSSSGRAKSSLDADQDICSLFSADAPVSGQEPEPQHVALLLCIKRSAALAMS